MNKRIYELAKEAGMVEFDRIPGSDAVTPDHTSVVKAQNFAELIVKETISEMIGQLWNYGIDESNNPSFYKAVERTKEHFGVK